MRELVRFTRVDICKLPHHPDLLRVLLVGKHVLNNPKAFRMDDIFTGDIVFYEEQ